ncbi:hypothetical protein K431DRAFT_73760 [Polychaeton citri CBS 116435]|uniref:Uncharacterized protein n=1 Tax=Polychaeton citri CBS 116435 TaxID=1314669 RepID=A0A9P4UNX7_9PEZI|nr:hypothetical protein K431DRAFT_73760 [Polychaeton citri CBS 116435]
MGPRLDGRLTMVIAVQGARGYIHVVASPYRSLLGSFLSVLLVPFDESSFVSNRSPTLFRPDSQRANALLGLTVTPFPPWYGLWPALSSSSLRWPVNESRSSCGSALGSQHFSDLQHSQRGGLLSVRFIGGITRLVRLLDRRLC